MQVGIIGGGASGMMAAVWAASKGAEVTILEHTSRVGKKILSTGNGKCNFTNENLSKDDYYCNHPYFVEGVLSKFSAESAIDFFEKSGMISIEKRGGYYYPLTGQAATVLNVLRNRLAGENITICTDTYIKKVSQNKRGGFSVFSDRETFCFDKLILATGGNAAPATGSDGSGYRIAIDFGHKVNRPLPVLTYLKCRDSLLKELAGVRAEAEISLFVNQSKELCERGEVQFNKDNISGIPVFQLSHRGIQALAEKNKVSLVVDFVPETEKKELITMIEKIREMYSDLPAYEVIGGIFHKKVCGAIFHRLQLSFDMKMVQLSKDEILQIAGIGKEFIFEISGYPGFDAAQATMGGVEVGEVDQNLQSRLVEGLYFTGEILDVDGRCGGYNLQWAWSSGYVAGCHCVDGEVECYESANVK